MRCAPERAGGAERRRIADVLDVGFVWRGGAVKTAAGRRPASSGRLRRALTRWSQIPIWDPSADDSDRYSFLNAERIPGRAGFRPADHGIDANGRQVGPTPSSAISLARYHWLPARPCPMLKQTRGDREGERTALRRLLPPERKSCIPFYSPL